MRHGAAQPSHHIFHCSLVTWNHCQGQWEVKARNQIFEDTVFWCPCHYVYSSPNHTLYVIFVYLKSKWLWYHICIKAMPMYSDQAYLLQHLWHPTEKVHRFLFKLLINCSTSTPQGNLHPWHSRKKYPRYLSWSRWKHVKLQDLWTKCVKKVVKVLRCQLFSKTLKHPQHPKTFLVLKVPDLVLGSVAASPPAQIAKHSRERHRSHMCSIQTQHDSQPLIFLTCFNCKPSNSKMFQKKTSRSQRFWAVHPNTSRRYYGDPWILSQINQKGRLTVPMRHRISRLNLVKCSDSKVQILIVRHLDSS